MNLFIVSLCFFAVATADVSHLKNRYLPPQRQSPSRERVETTIEQHELRELPTQIEIIKDGQPIYGVKPQPLESLRIAEPMDIQEYMPRSQDIADLLPPQLPFEMPMRTYLPPFFDNERDAMATTTAAADINADDMSNTEKDTFTTTTVAPTENEDTTAFAEPTTTESLSSVDMTTEQTTTSSTEEQQFELRDNQSREPQEQQQHMDSTTLPTSYLPPNEYLPPSMTMMLPPPPPIEQPTYQQYQEQLLREQQMQQRYREQEMQEMMHAIAEMEKQKMLATEQPEHQMLEAAMTISQRSQFSQMQPVVPDDTAHVLREDGYHYKTASDSLARFRLRH